MPNPRDAGTKPDHQVGDGFEEVQGGVNLTYRAEFIEVGFNYLSAIRNGDPDPIIQRERIRFERSLADEPSIRDLPDDQFATAAREALQRIADENQIPMDLNYRGTKPDPSDRTTHFPLTRDEIQELLTQALTTDNQRLISKIRVRLNDAVEGMEHPRPIEGPVAERTIRLNQLYAQGIEDGGMDDFADKIYALTKA